MSNRPKRKAARRIAKRREREAASWRAPEPIPPVELFVRMRPGGPPPVENDGARRVLPHVIERR